MFDKVTLFMIFIMLCFAGLTVMFYFLLKAIDDLGKDLKTERKQLITSLQGLEASLEKLTVLKNITNVNTQTPQPISKEKVINTTENKSAQKPSTVSLPDLSLEQDRLSIDNKYNKSSLGLQLDDLNSVLRRK